MYSHEFFIPEKNNKKKTSSESSTWHCATSPILNGEHVPYLGQQRDPLPFLHQTPVKAFEPFRKNASKTDSPVDDSDSESESDNDDPVPGLIFSLDV